MERTQECIEHQMTEAQLARFLAANGLRRDGGQLLAQQGGQVGSVRQTCGGPLAILVFQETYRRDACEVTAWWPSFRPAWTLVAGDGEVEVGDLLGPDEVICDLCNADIAIRPVPVVGGYAHCADCFARLGIPFPSTVRPYCVHLTSDAREVS
jgi:hypothetical protein